MQKLKKDNIAIIVAVLLIIAYIIFQFYSVSHIELETQVATLSTVYEKIDATALVVRDEHTVSSTGSGVTVPCISDGDKVKVGGNVAMRFSSSDEAEKFSQYSDIQRQLSYYENLEEQTVGQVASVETLDSEIADKVDEYIRTVSKGTDGATAKGSEVNDSIMRRQMLIGENVDLVSIIQELRQQSEKYASSKPEGYITTDVSGVFSSYSDGLEKAVDYSKAEEMTADDIKSALKKAEENRPDNEKYLGKLVTSYKWYFMCVVSADDVLELEDGDKVQVALRDSGDTVITMQIVSGAQPDVGAKETALILKSSEMNPEIATLRRENIEIRIKAKEGFRVPSSALHVENGQKGVYALISSQIKFRKAEVIYSDEDYVLLKFDPDDKDGIRLYDKIITQGKGLSDGKVYT